MDNTHVTFLFQFGSIRNLVSISLCDITLKTLKEMACAFINNKIPENGLTYFFDDILLFRHDYTNPNILQIINSVAEIVNETLIEIVITASPWPYPHIDINPHSLIVHSFKAPTFCDFCGEMLFGLVRQGLKCEGCGQNYHKRCVVKIPNNCNSAIEPSSRVSCLQFSRYLPNESTTSEHRGNESMNSFERTKGQELIDSSNKRASFIHLPYQGRVQIPHTFLVHTYGIPTVCQHCKKLLRGIFKQGFQCRDCSYNAHKKCVVNVPQDCKGEKQIAEHESTKERKVIFNGLYNNSQISVTSCLDKKKEQNSPQDINLREDQNLVELGHEQSESSSLSPPSTNIPLMRIVQSVKHTKKRGSQAIKEGWLVHFTNLDKTIRHCFWRLDSKTITLFISEQSTKYHKEIPLKEILSVDSNHNVNNENNFCFEIRTANIHYFVGQHIIYAQRDSQIHLSSMDTGIGADKAKKWEMAIKQSLMHVTNTQCWESEENVQDMGQLYQIFAEEVLGSGQFGVVYGGIHKKSGREVAVKVIDKLRFPTKQESQLKNEVAILQNISHCGIVNLERTFETAERIFVVMEKLRGDMLEMILSCEQGRLTERVAKFLITQILIALKHLHNKNIVHCDLKPENVLLSSDCEFPQVKLCDFGYARIIGEKSFRRSVVGTPAYLAPEVLCNKGYNRSLDMWSVGVIIYVSLSGTFPFNEEEDINDQIQNAAFMYPLDTWKEISSNAIDLINNLLQVNQRKRYTVDKSLQHSWLQGKQTYEDLIVLEAQVGTKYLTHEADEIRWAKNNDI